MAVGTNKLIKLMDYGQLKFVKLLSSLHDVFIFLRWAMVSVTEQQGHVPRSELMGGLCCTRVFPCIFQLYLPFPRLDVMFFAF